MKSFLWRMRSNFGWFLAAVVIFTIVYFILAYSNIKYFYDNNTVRCLDGIDPSIVSGCVSFAFFFVCAKRYTYDEAYLYGQSRKGAMTSALCSAALYSIIFACYTLGAALLVRRAILSAPNLAVSAYLYRLTAVEIIYNFAYLFVINMIAYETANLLRKFKSWKFWITIAVCVATFVVLYVFNVVLPQSNGVISDFDFWKAMFAVVVPQMFIMVCGDMFMTRGRQCR